MKSFFSLAEYLNAIEVNSLGFLAEDAKYWEVTDMS